MNYKTLEDVKRVISLGKGQEVIDSFAESYLQGEKYNAWLDAHKAEHEALYPKQIDGDEILDDEGNPTGTFEQVDNPDYIDFDTYMAGTEQVEVGSKDVLDEDGITVIGTEPIYEDRLIRQYVEVDVSVDVSEWKLDNYAMLRESEYPSFLEYIDGIVKGDANQQKAYIDTCKAIKAKYPKRG